MPSRELEAIEPTEENVDASLSKRTRMARAATLLREAPVPKRKDDPKPPRDTMPLKKTGETTEIRVARDRESGLRTLLEEQPTLFRALQAIVEGQNESVGKRQLRNLKDWGYLAPDHSLLPWVKPIMEAAFRQTPDGPCIVNPLDVRTPTDAVTVERVDGQLEQIHRQGFDRLRRALFDQDKKEGKGPDSPGK